MSNRAGYLLDTNVLSETRRKRPHPGVTTFLHSAEASSLYVSVLVLGELRKGIAPKHASDQQGATLLEAWVDGFESGFANRILGIDIATARLWGELSAHRPRPVVDTLLAATALVHGLTLVTRNQQDVADIPRLKTYDPWSR